MAPSSKRNAGAVSLLGQVLYLLTVVYIALLPGLLREGCSVLDPGARQASSSKEKELESEIYSN